VGKFTLWGQMTAQYRREGAATHPERMAKSNYVRGVVHNALGNVDQRRRRR